MTAIKDTSSPSVAAFSILTWRADLTVAALSFATSAKVILELVLKGRGVVEVDTAREAIVESLAKAHAATTGCTFEEATKAKSIQNRVADAMAVFKAKTLPASMPSNLQHAAKACREANPGAPRAPQQPKAPVVPTVAAKDVNPMALLIAALEALRTQCGDNAPALDLISELSDLAVNLLEALKPVVAPLDKAA